MMIRKMAETDIEAVAKLEAELFSVPWSAQGFADTLGREDILFLVAYENDELLGYVGVYCTADEGEITNVAVAKAVRRRGIGRALLEHLIQMLAQQHIYRLVLEVRVSNAPAIGLYEQLRFQIAGRRKNFYERPVEDAYVMVLEPTVYYSHDSDLSL